MDFSKSLALCLEIFPVRKTSSPKRTGKRIKAAFLNTGRPLT
jgi:hypothetical protein